MSWQDDVLAKVLARKRKNEDVTGRDIMDILKHEFN
jgi:hypothetical protein